MYKAFRYENIHKIYDMLKIWKYFNTSLQVGAYKFAMANLRRNVSNFFFPNALVSIDSINPLYIVTNKMAIKLNMFSPFMKDRILAGLLSHNNDIGPT